MQLEWGLGMRLTKITSDLIYLLSFRIYLRVLKAFSVFPLAKRKLGLSGRQRSRAAAERQGNVHTMM